MQVCSLQTKAFFAGLLSVTCSAFVKEKSQRSDQDARSDVSVPSAADTSFSWVALRNLPCNQDRDVRISRIAKSWDTIRVKETSFK